MSLALLLVLIAELKAKRPVPGRLAQRLGSNLGPIVPEQGLKPAIKAYVSA